MEDRFYPDGDTAEQIVSKILDTEEFADLMLQTRNIMGDRNLVDLVLSVSHQLLIIAGSEVVDCKDTVLQANEIANDLFFLLAEKAQIPPQVMLIVLSALLTKVVVKSISTLQEHEKEK